jgi:hypothetical protein
MLSRGRARIVISETILIAEVAIIEALVEIHLPSMRGFQIFSRGQHAKMKAKNKAKYVRAFDAMRTFTAQ